MTRLYDPLGVFKCSLCHRYPNIGWLYRCTEDSGGYLPESDFVNDSPRRKKTTPAQDVTLHTLSMPIIKAIGEGQYTDDQIKFMVQQKEKVRDTILAQQPRPVTASTITTASSSASTQYDTLSTLPESTTFSTTSTTSLDDEIRKAYDWKELQNTWMSESIAPTSEPASSSLTHSNLKARLTALSSRDCTFKICPTCRPTYRERAFQSLGDVFNNPVKLPPYWELENRPISDVVLLAKIQIPSFKETSVHSQTPSNSAQSSPSLASEEGLQAKTNATSRSIDSHSVRKRSGFRQTVRKALARARSEDHLDVSDDQENEIPNDNTLGTTRPSRSLVFRRRRSRPAISFISTHGRVVDTSGLHDSVMLMLATNTPLPRTPTILFGQSTRRMNPNIEHVQDGMNLRMSDVITQS